MIWDVHVAARMAIPERAQEPEPTNTKTKEKDLI
jgi:hypothetical protein